MDRQEKVERYLSTAMWWKGLRETNNEAFLPLFFDQHRYLVLKGGGGSGKSIFVGRKVLGAGHQRAGTPLAGDAEGGADAAGTAALRSCGVRSPSITRTPAPRSTRATCGSGSPTVARFCSRVWTM